MQDWNSNHTHFKVWRNPKDEIDTILGYNRTIYVDVTSEKGSFSNQEIYKKVGTSRAEV